MYSGIACCNKYELSKSQIVPSRTSFIIHIQSRIFILQHPTLRKKGYRNSAPGVLLLQIVYCIIADVVDVVTSCSGAKSGIAINRAMLCSTEFFIVTLRMGNSSDTPSSEWNFHFQLQYLYWECHCPSRSDQAKLRKYRFNLKKKTHTLWKQPASYMYVQTHSSFASLASPSMKCSSTKMTASIFSTIHPHQKTHIKRFLTQWPWPLTYDLDLITWPRYSPT